MHFSELGDEFVIAIMKKTVYILCFLMILSAVIPAIADSRETLVQQEAEEIVRNRMCIINNFEVNCATNLILEW